MTLFGDEPILENLQQPEARIHQLTTPKIETYRLDNSVSLDVIGPVVPESQKIILSNQGENNLVTLIEQIIKTEGQIRMMYASTWTINHDAIEKLLLLAGSSVDRMAILVSLYYKRGKAGTYSRFYFEQEQREEIKLMAAPSHAKVVTHLTHTGKHITIESSANMSRGHARTNWEQHTITENPGLYKFHTRWMQSFF